MAFTKEEFCTSVVTSTRYPELRPVLELAETHPRNLLLQWLRDEVRPCREEFLTEHDPPFSDEDMKWALTLALKELRDGQDQKMDAMVRYVRQEYSFRFEHSDPYLRGRPFSLRRLAEGLHYPSEEDVLSREELFVFLVKMRKELYYMSEAMRLLYRDAEIMGEQIRAGLYPKGYPYTPRGRDTYHD